MFVNCSYIVSFVVKSPSGDKIHEQQHLRIQEGHFLKIALNLDLTLSDDGECPIFFDSLRNYWFRCVLRRVMVIFRQQKNFGPNVIYFVVGTSTYFFWFMSKCSGQPVSIYWTRSKFNKSADPFWRRACENKLVTNLAQTIQQLAPSPR